VDIVRKRRVSISGTFSTHFPSRDLLTPVCGSTQVASAHNMYENRLRIPEDGGGCMRLSSHNMVNLQSFNLGARASSTRGREAHGWQGSARSEEDGECSDAGWWYRRVVSRG
jgi:hypothetical protein